MIYLRMIYWIIFLVSFALESNIFTVKTVVFDIEHGKATVQYQSLAKVLETLNIRIAFESPLMIEFNNYILIKTKVESDCITSPLSVFHFSLI